ncbi:MAG: aryl-sulfate sulfotransferase [Actinomycetota bacterium]
MKRWVSLAVAAAASIAAVLVAVGGGPLPVRAASTADVFCGGPTTSEVTPGPTLEGFTSIEPERFVDTRDGTGGVDQLVDAGCTLRLRFDAGDLPDGAAAAAISLTAVAEQRGFYTVFPCASGRPGSSNLNARGDDIATPNLVVATLDPTGAICVFAQRASHLIIDVTGWWGPGDTSFSSIAPVRADDTRATLGARLPKFNVRAIPLGGIYVPSDATAVLVNATVTGADQRGFLQVYPCGQDAPDTSALNFLAGESRAVAVVVGIGGPGGQLCVQSNRDAHIIIDVMGYYAPRPDFGPTPALQTLVGDRLVDSRDGTGGVTGKFDAKEVRTLTPVAGHPAEAEASAVLLNVVATEGDGAGHLRVFPCDPQVPEVSNLNFVGESSVSNLVPVELSDAGTVCIYAHRRTHVVVDLVGVMAAPNGELAERLAFDAPVWPPYRPDGVDYGIECTDSTSSITIDVDPLPGARAFVDGDPVDLDGESLAVPLAIDELTTVVLRRGNDIREYVFRCLPADFPQLAVERGDTLPTPGWYLTTFGQGGSPSGEFVVILDEYGAPVWHKRADTDVLNFDRRPDGSLRVTNLGQFFGIPSDGVRTRLFDLDGNAVAGGVVEITADARMGLPGVPYPNWEDELPIDHHDHVDLPNGGSALLSYPLRTGVDLTPLNGQVPCTPPEGETDCFFADEWVVDSTIIEVDADGNLLWTWNSFDDGGIDRDAMDDYEPLDAGFPQRFGRYADPDSAVDAEVRGELDLVHINALQRVANGDYVATARHLDAVFRIDRSSGALAWYLSSPPPLGGSPAANAVRLTIVGDPLGGPLRPHDARYNDATGVLTMFDNRSGTTDPARVVAYQIDTGAMTATLLWQFDEPQGRTSPAQGAARVADDGSLLVTWGGLQPVFEEYTAAVDGVRELLLRIAQVPGGTSFRIIKHPLDAFDRDELRASTGGSLPPI